MKHNLWLKCFILYTVCFPCSLEIRLLSFFIVKNILHICVSLNSYCHAVHQTVLREILPSSGYKGLGEPVKCFKTLLLHQRNSFIMQSYTKPLGSVRINPLQYTVVTCYNQLKKGKNEERLPPMKNNDAGNVSSGRCLFGDVFRKKIKISVSNISQNQICFK